MTRMDCPRCDTKCDLEETRASFNHYYAGSADWDDGRFWPVVLGLR